MKNSDFFHNLKANRKLELVEPSQNITQGYLKKSSNCEIAAKVVHEAGVYENAISEAYYSMYNIVMALFFSCGIKCENHICSGLLLDAVFHLPKLSETILAFKKERIEKQYYIIQEDQELSKEECKKLLDTAQKFNAEIAALIEKISNEDKKRIQLVIQKM